MTRKLLVLLITPGNEHKRKHYAGSDAYRFSGYILSVSKRNSFYLITTFPTAFQTVESHLPDRASIFGQFTFWALFTDLILLSSG